MTTDEVVETVQDFRRAAAAARAAGADGVEFHGANGYLVHQFLSSNANNRRDRYGGSVANRIRFAVEVATAVADEIGAARTGIRISPGGAFNDIVENDSAEVDGALVPALARLDLAYLHLLHGGDEETLRAVRDDWPGPLVLNRGGADLATRIEDIELGNAEVIAVGAMSLANPDLVARIKADVPLNDPDRSTFYGGDERGYTDYPTAQLVGS